MSLKIYLLRYLKGMMNIKKYILKDYGFIILLCTLWSYNTLLRYFFILLSYIPFVGSGIQKIVLPFMLLIIIFIGGKFIVKNIKKTEILVYLAIIILVLSTLIVGSDQTKKFNDYWVSFLFLSIPMFWVGKSLFVLLKRNYDVISLFSYISCCAIITTMLIYFREGQLVSESWMSNQYLPYLLLPHMTLLMLRISQKFNVAFFLTLISGLMFMLLCGNRWSVFCLVFYFLILIIHYTATMKKQIRVIVIATVFICLVSIYMGEFYVFLSEKLIQLGENLGMSTRSLSFLLNSSTQAEFDSGRSEIQKKLIKACLNNPLGYGFCSDWYFVGMYAHNIFLELLVEHGFLFGGMACFGIIYTFVKSLVKSMEWKTKSIIWLFFSISFLKLLISGTYLNEPIFFLLIGFCVSTINDNSGQIV